MKVEKKSRIGRRRPAKRVETKQKGNTITSGHEIHKRRSLVHGILTSIVLLLVWYHPALFLFFLLSHSLSPLFFFLPLLLTTVAKKKKKKKRDEAGGLPMITFPFLCTLLLCGYCTLSMTPRHPQNNIDVSMYRRRRKREKSFRQVSLRIPSIDDNVFFLFLFFDNRRHLNVVMVLSLPSLLPRAFFFFFGPSYTPGF